ncbi:MAG: hypothetical protein BWZ01_03118 [Deltaproteobacteria bacterium ADurb.BinA179]|nr:MAG: hypothetical protein BWZ01_03118 [Deltaproteobacteria bacterium ADurb.BinA179]
MGEISQVLPVAGMQVHYEILALLNELSAWRRGTVLRIGGAVSRGHLGRSRDRPVILAAEPPELHLPDSGDLGLADAHIQGFFHPLHGGIRHGRRLPEKQNFARFLDVGGSVHDRKRVHELRLGQRLEQKFILGRKEISGVAPGGMAELDADHGLVPAVLADLTHHDVQKVEPGNGGVRSDVVQPGLTVHAGVVDEHGDESRIAVPGDDHGAAPGDEGIGHIGDTDRPGTDEDIDACSGHFLADPFQSFLIINGYLHAHLPGF